MTTNQPGDTTDRIVRECPDCNDEITDTFERSQQRLASHLANDH